MVESLDRRHDVSLENLLQLPTGKRGQYFRRLTRSIVAYAKHARMYNAEAKSTGTPVSADASLLLVHRFIGTDITLFI